MILFLVGTDMVDKMDSLGRMTWSGLLIVDRGTPTLNSVRRNHPPGPPAWIPVLRRGRKSHYKRGDQDDTIGPARHVLISGHVRGVDEQADISDSAANKTNMDCSVRP